MLAVALTDASAATFSTRVEKEALAEPGNLVPQLSHFLDRLMLAESGGRDTAANPRSSALGPFQFIKSTFISIARRHFPAEVAELNDAEVLALRTTRSFARATAAVFTLENAVYLKSQGIQPTLPHLRLAFLLGPTGAVRVLQAEPQARLSSVVGAGVIGANPFMVGVSASALVARATRDIYGGPKVAAAPRAIAVRPDPRPRPAARAQGGPPAVAALDIKCNQKLASCQRWIALKQEQATRSAQTAGKRKTGAVPKLRGAGA
ncbi:MAG: hypothetical protein ACKVP3_28805 [Hyphomicrobiaceae bacterium]